MADVYLNMLPNNDVRTTKLFNMTKLNISNKQRYEWDSGAATTFGARSFVAWGGAVYIGGDTTFNGLPMPTIYKDHATTPYAYQMQRTGALDAASGDYFSVDQLHATMNVANTNIVGIGMPMTSTGGLSAWSNPYYLIYVSRLGADETCYTN